MWDVAVVLGCGSADVQPKLVMAEWGSLLSAFVCLVGERVAAALGWETNAAGSPV